KSNGASSAGKGRWRSSSNLTISRSLPTTGGRSIGLTATTVRAKPTDTLRGASPRASNSARSAAAGVSASMTNVSTRFCWTTAPPAGGRVGGEAARLHDLADLSVRKAERLHRARRRCIDVDLAWGLHGHDVPEARPFLRAVEDRRLLEHAMDLQELGDRLEVGVVRAVGQRELQ